MPKTATVIGGGLGGISAALCLGNQGYEVGLYEKNGHLGGKLNLLEQDGFSFDLGPSILTFPHVFEKLFRDAGKDMRDYLRIVEPEVHWRCFFEDGVQIDLPRDPDRLREANSALTEQDAADFRDFMDYSHKLYDNVEEVYFRKSADNLREMVANAGVVKSLTGFDVWSTMHQGVGRRVRNPYLAHILDFFVKYVGSSAYDAPAVLNMIPYGQYRFGLWYVEGGMYELARGLARLMREQGIDVHTNTEITELRSKNGSITAAMTKDGDTIRGDVFVSNMEVIPAYRELTHESEDFLSKFDKFEPACSGLVLHLGVRKQYPQLAHHNFFFSDNPEKHFSDVFHKKTLPEDPTIYLVAPGRTNSAVAPEGCDNIKILPHIPYVQDEPFSREDYLQLRGRVLAKLERMGLEDLRENIITEHMWTPEDIRSLYYSNRGAIYGVIADKKRNLGFKAPKRSGKYGNLYFVGGSVNPGGGMPMATLSGQQAADIIGREHA